MPNAIYNYVYYEPLQVGGPVTRQNRNPATSSKYLPVPGITVPSTNDLATGSMFNPDTPPKSFIDSNNNEYTFGFMTVSGCVGAGETSSEYGQWPGSGSFPPLIVGTQVINILVMYINNGAPGIGGNGGPGIYLDAFDETTGTFLDNFFVTSINPDNSLTSNVNVYGSLAVEPRAETVLASSPPINTPAVANSLANFDKWVALEGPTGNPVITGNSPSMVVGASTPGNITAFAFYKDPASVYITGGYQSPDILLFTPFSTTSLGTEVPLGAGGGASTVQTGVNYGFAAVVHNDSSYEVSTQVTFWNIPGGVGTAGALLDTQTAIIPANSSMTVFSSQPFINVGGHTCAVVSIDTADSPCQFAPANSADSVHIPNPDANVSHSCSAWRNTNAMSVVPGQPWHFGIGLGELNAEYADLPVAIQLQSTHVAADFVRNDRVLEVVKTNERIYRKAPAYLIPELRATLPVIDLKPVVSLVSKGNVEVQKAGNSYLLKFADAKQTDFEISGVTPADAKPGDTYLVQVTAQYPKTRSLAAKSVGFLEILIVESK
jgi:hypothetical protein